MADELRTILTATDQASPVIDEVAGKIERYDGETATAEITADDQATDPIADVRRRLDGLTDDEAEVVLKAEKRAAERDVRAFRREILELDDEQAIVEVRANKDQAQRRVDEIESELQRLDRTTVTPEVDVDTDAGSAAGDQLSTDFTDAFAGGLKGASVAGAIAGFVSIVQTGFERSRFRAVMRERFGLVAADAADIGADAADAFAAGWGESTAEITNALGLIQQQLVDTNLITDETADAIQRRVLAIAEVWETDYQQVIRSTAQIIRNGLAPDAEVALDLIVEGLQNGANLAGDFFESIDEYSQHFAGFGLSAQDMFAIFTHGIQNGQRDTDKLADAIKELRIRTLEDSDEIGAAFQRMGLDQTEVQAQIAEGGQVARDAYLSIVAALGEITDPTEQHRTAVSVLGTQYEDLGPKALDSLSAVGDGYIEATGAAEQLTTRIEDQQSQLDELQRRAKTAAAEIGEELATATNVGLDALQGDFDAIDRLTTQVSLSTLESAKSVGEFDAALAAMAEQLGVTEERLLRSEGIAALRQSAIDGASSVAIVADEIDNARQRLAEQQAAAEGAADGLDDVGDSADDTADDTADLTDEVADLVEQYDALVAASGRLVGGDLRVRESQLRAADATDRYTDALNGRDAQGKETEVTDRQLEQALIDATQANIAAATAAADYEIAQREASNEVLAGADQNAILAEQLRTVAATLDPDSAVRANLLGYANDLDEIPANVETTMNLATPIEQLQRYIDLIGSVPLSRTTTLAIQENVRREGRFEQGRLPTGQSHVGSRFGPGDAREVVPGQVWQPDVSGRLLSVEESERTIAGRGGTGSVYVDLRGSTFNDMRPDDVARAARDTLDLYR